MTLRDITSAYKAAYLEEYESYTRAGYEKKAAKVAAILLEQFGVDVAPKPEPTPPTKPAAKKAAPRERATASKAPEKAVEPKEEGIMPAPTLHDEDTGCLTYAAHIANVAGGATVDAESRTAVNAILVALRAAGIIAQD